jgi:hypothetical protein
LNRVERVAALIADAQEMAKIGGPGLLIWYCERFADLGLPLPVIDPLAAVQPWRLLEIGSVVDPLTPITEELHFYQPNGDIDAFTPDRGEWCGWPGVAEILRDLLPEHTALHDISLCPSFIEHAKAAGFSGAAASGAPVDVLTAFDFWQRVYLERFDEHVDAARGRLRPGGIAVFKIRTCASGERTVERDTVNGSRVTAQNGWLLASGTVLVRTWEWWALRFSLCGLKVRRDLCHKFQEARGGSKDLRDAEDWDAQHVLFCERV